MNKNFHELDQTLSEICNRAKIPGAAVIASQNGERLYENFLGYRDVENKKHVTGDTIFGVASLTKSLAALALMMLQDDGKLSVHDEVIKYLPELTSIQPKTTIHHLLTHTAGYPGIHAFNLARLENLRRDADGEYLFGSLPSHSGKSVRTVNDMIHVMNEMDIQFIGLPGELFNYSNESYAFLQEIVERVSRKSFEEFIQKFVFDPLHMDHSVFQVTDLKQFSDVTEIYAFTKDEKKEPFHSPTWWESGHIYSAGALKASTKDIMKYLEIFRKDGFVNGKQIVSKKGVQDMLTTYVDTPNENKYGYGFLAGTYAGVNVVGHGGGVKGVSSYMLVAKKQGITITVLTNIAEVAAENISLTALRYLLELEEPTIEQSILQLTTEQFETYCGLYETDEGQRVEVKREENGLKLKIQHNTVYVKPYKEHIFQLNDGKKIAFLPDGQGEIKGVFRGMRYLQKSKN